MALKTTERVTELITAEQLAEEWQMSAKTLESWRSKRIGPPYHKMHGLIRYSRKAVEEWLAAQQEARTA